MSWSGLCKISAKARGSFSHEWLGKQSQDKWFLQPHTYMKKQKRRIENLWLDQKVKNWLSQSFSKRMKGFKFFARIKTDGQEGESKDMLIWQKTLLTVRPFEIKGSLCGMEQKERCNQSHALWFETELLGEQQMLRSTAAHRRGYSMELGSWCASVTVPPSALGLPPAHRHTESDPAGKQFQSCNLKEGKFGSLIFPSPLHCSSFLQVYSEDKDVCIAA